MTHDDWRWVIDVDLWGPIHGVEAFLPRMVEQGEGGHILFTASFAGLVPNVGLGPYCVAKYGVVALAEVLVPGAARARHRRVGAVPDAGRHEHRPAPSATAAPTTAAPSGLPVPDQDAATTTWPAGCSPSTDVAALTVDAIEQNRLYVLPHDESRESIRRRFDRIDRTFDEQPPPARADVAEQPAELLHLGVGEHTSGAIAPWPLSMRSATLRPAAVSSRMRKR